MALLQHLHILASSVDEDGTRGYFLPCVLRHASQCSAVHNLIVDPLLVSFACGFTPNGMFCGLLVFFLQYNGLNVKICKKQLYRDQASLYVKPFISLTIKAMPKYIRFSLHQQCDTVNTSGICATVKVVIEKGLNEVASRLNYKINAEPRFGFECTCGNQNPTHFTEYSCNPWCKSTEVYCKIPSFGFTKWFHKGEIMYIIKHTTCSVSIIFLK